MSVLFFHRDHLRPSSALELIWRTSHRHSCISRVAEAQGTTTPRKSRSRNVLAHFATATYVTYIYRDWLALKKRLPKEFGIRAVSNPRMKRGASKSEATNQTRQNHPPGNNTKKNYTHAAAAEALLNFLRLLP